MKVNLLYIHTAEKKHKFQSAGGLDSLKPNLSYLSALNEPCDMAVFHISWRALYLASVNLRLDSNAVCKGSWIRHERNF
jgi:hypothetical protein